MSTNDQNTSIEDDSQSSVVDLKNIIHDKYLYEKYYVTNANGKLTVNEVQIPVQSHDVSEDESNVEAVDTQEEENEVKEVIGVQLRFVSDEKNNGNSNVVDTPTQPQYDPSIDERLPETVTLLTTPEGGKLYLVGTAHFSIESQNDVAMVIQAVQPDAVVVELCKSRIAVMNVSENVLYRNATDLSFQNLTEILKEHGTYSGLLYITLYRMVAHIVKELGMPPGGEFRTAFTEAKKVPNCIIQLADRSINVTFERTLRALTWWEIIRLFWLVVHLKARISKQDVEKYKKKSVIEKMIKELKEQYPTIERTFVTERDLYLTYHLQMATSIQHTAERSRPPRVVGVVGIGHMNGIIANWGKVKVSDIHAIMLVPPKPLSCKILIFTFKASLYGAAIYVGYKIIPLPSINIFQSLKSSIEALLKATAFIDKYEHTIPGIMYVVQNIPGPGIDIEEFESEYTLGCMCTDQCFDCSCTRGSPNYTNGLLSDEKLSGPIIECNSHCTCRENCGNRVIQKGPLDFLIVSETSQKGLGLFTTKSIRKGQFICEYAGEVIGIEEARRRVEENKYSMNYVLVVSEHIGDRVIVTCIDPKYFGNIGRYSNHSCEPNANLVPIRVEGTVPRLCLFASRDIQIGEEITFNYAGEVSNSVHNLSDTPCHCGSNNCSGYLPHNSI